MLDKLREVTSLGLLLATIVSSLAVVLYLYGMRP